VKPPALLRRLRRSLGLRLALLFAALALVMALVFLGGMQRALSAGWQSFVRPLLYDYVDRLAAEIGSPPDRARAEALVARLPLAIRIEGPSVNYDSAPDSAAGRWRRDRPGADGWQSRNHDEDWLLVRSTADGHRIVFGLAPQRWQERPRWIGWATLAVLLALTAAAYAATRRLFRPIADIGAGAARFGRGDFSTPIPVRGADELGELAGQVNTMATELEAMLEAKRGLLLAISHELRSPLTRARLNAELVAEGEARDALLRDLAEMRELVHDLLEG
jgi:signal transduction histidine kinase